MGFNINHLGENIKKFRELKGYTQDNMATELSMTSQGYGRIERNEVDMTIKKLQRIAEILNTSIEDIFGFDEKMVFNNQECQNYGFGNKNTVHLQVDLAEIHNLYKQLLAEKDVVIETLRSQLKQAKK